MASSRLIAVRGLGEHMAYIPFMYIFGGLLLVAVSVPMINRRIGRNGFYGFRTPKTLSDDRIWYDANEYAGRQLFAAGLITSVGSTILTLIPQLDALVRILGCLAVMIGALMWSIVRSMAYLNKLN
jgi:uncharacterized membrane protein